jgi:hypothetical protein
MRLLIVGLALAMAACGPKTGDVPKSTEAAVQAPPNAATLKAYAAPLQGADQIDNAANVSRVVHLSREGVKLYSLIGGDPAINGDYAVLGLFQQPNGWFTYRIGDFNTWEVVEQSADRVVLQVSHSAVEEGSSDIVSYTQKIAVALPPMPEDGDPPATIQVTPVE